MAAHEDSAASQLVMPPYFAYHPSISVLTVSAPGLDNCFLSDEASNTPLALIQWLHSYHVLVDAVVSEFEGLWKFSSMNGCFCVAAGVLVHLEHSHVELLVRLCQRLKTACATITLPNGLPLQPSFLIHTGDAVSGVLGCNRLDYEIVGAVVQVSRAMSQLVPASHVVLTEAALASLSYQKGWEPCGAAEVLGTTYTCYAQLDRHSHPCTLLGTSSAQAFTLLSPPSSQPASRCKTVAEGPYTTATGYAELPDHDGTYPALPAGVPDGQDGCSAQQQQLAPVGALNALWLNFLDDATERVYLQWLARNAYLTDVLTLFMRTAFNLSAALQHGDVLLFLVPLLSCLLPLYMAVAFRTWYQRQRVWVLMLHALAACLCAVHLHAPSFLTSATTARVGSTIGLFKATGAETVIFNVMLQLPFRQHFMLQLLSVALLVPLVPASCAKAADVLTAGDQPMCMLMVAFMWHFMVAGLLAAVLSYGVQYLHMQRFQEECLVQCAAASAAVEGSHAKGIKHRRVGEKSCN